VHSLASFTMSISGTMSESGHSRRREPLVPASRCPLRPPNRPNDLACAKCREGPCVDGSGLARRIFTLQRWSEQPCVRPVCAVHMTAGHNALRGSGPGQKHAFDDAVALVGCPDRRIDRHCITCCSPFQPLHHAGLSGVILFMPRGRQVPYSVRSWPSSPRPSWRACWRARWRQLWSVAAPTTR
jgi:hypothetical protein